MKKIILTITLFIAMTIVVIIVVKNITLKQNCTGYLKRAADANTVEFAKEQLEKAISYLEAKNLTSGYTSVLWKTPDEDIEFWYKNLKASQTELSKVDSTTSSLEKTNMLMKLRETLIDVGDEGDELTVPKGLSRYPNNLLWGILLWFSVSLLVAVALWYITDDEYGAY